MDSNSAIIIKPLISLDSILFFSVILDPNNRIVNANTRAILAIFDPRAFPIAILPFPSKLEIIEINISGDDVASPIKIKLEINFDILNFLDISSVEETSTFAP